MQTVAPSSRISLRSRHRISHIAPASAKQPVPSFRRGFRAAERHRPATRPCASMAAATQLPTVLFDFDGTLGDTETPAMEVAYWELVPYFPNVKVADLTEEFMAEFIRENAGKAFEFMVEKCNEDRAAAGLPPLEEVRDAKAEDPDLLAFADTFRERTGLATFAQMRGPGGEEPADFLTQQKDETVEALRTLAEACPGVKDTLTWLTDNQMSFAIATTSGKPRVPVSVLSAGLDIWFSPEKIHSGESDFDPPRFKPDPSVYLLAADSEKSDIANCIAVEDSASGVGSAANSGIGMIVGYVGASHIKEAVINEHAEMLMKGEKAESGIGADLVIEDFSDLTTLATYFKELPLPRPQRPLQIPDSVVSSLKGRYWLRK